LIKVQSHTFSGDLDIEEFLNWIAECDKVKGYKNIIEKKDGEISFL
jgi:hypothetical protein